MDRMSYQRVPQSVGQNVAFDVPPADSPASYKPFYQRAGSSHSEDSVMRHDTHLMSSQSVWNMLTRGKDVDDEVKRVRKCSRWLKFKLGLCGCCCCSSCAIFIVIFVPFLMLPGLMPNRDYYNDVAYHGEDHDMLYGDAWHGVQVDPLYMSEGFPAENYMIIDHLPEEAGWTNNGSHLHIPFFWHDDLEYKFTPMIQARYKTRFHGTDNFEIGILNMKTDYNMVGSISPKITWGTAEKRHVYKVGKELDKEAYDSIQDIPRKQWAVTKWIAKRMAWLRRVLITIFYGSNWIGTQMLELGANTESQHAPIEAFARANKGEPNSMLTRNMSNLRKAVADAFKNADLDLSKPPLFNYLGCYHFGPDTPGGLQTSKTGVWVPLNKKLMSFMGQIVPSPVRSMQFYAGTSIVRQDNETGKYEFYIAASIHSKFGDPIGDSGTQSAFQSSLTIGPADGSSMEIPQLQRRKFGSPSLVLHGLWKLIHMIPEDYTYFLQDDEAACPSYHEYQGSLRQLSATGFTFNKFTTGNPPLTEKLSFLFRVDKHAACLLHYVRPSGKEFNSFGLYTVSGCTHSLLEVALDNVVMIMGARDWDKISPPRDRN